jgi:hypothetical protein
MTPTKLRERLSDGRVDEKAFLEALTYVREDGRD